MRRFLSTGMNFSTNLRRCRLPITSTATAVETARSQRASMKITVPDLPEEPHIPGVPSKYLTYAEAFEEYGFPDTVLRPHIRSGRLEALKMNPGRRGAV